MRTKRMKRISQKEPALEILNKQHLQENKESGDLLSVKPALETIQQMPRSLSPGKSWAGIFKVEPSQPPLKMLIYQQPEINDKEPALEVIGTGDDLSEIKLSTEEQETTLRHIYLIHKDQY
ncbi:hypothetical protein TNCV_3689021 [Trichonephila clavipes]|nr:hypothetical protein TNCV_3689021 [Trichonephila clavipes]